MPSGVYKNNKGKTLSSATKKKISKNHSRHNLGKHLSIETKKKISDSKRGGKMSEETKRKISEANSGKKNYKWISDRSLLKTDRLKGKRERKKTYP